MSAPLKITMHPAISSNIAAAGYDAASRTLEIRFSNGATYRYQDVPKEVYEGMWKSESMGKFVAANIAKSYKFAKVVKVNKK